jgi:hypothetical protein
MKWLRLLVRPRLLAVYGFALASLLGMLAMETLAPPQRTPPGVTATPLPLRDLTVAQPALTLRLPAVWSAPVVIDAQTVLVSPQGSRDTGPMAGPFLLIITDALPSFSLRLAFRTDYTDPRQQLDALITALNRTAVRFSRAKQYDGSPYPAAITRGYERGNELTIVLLNAGERGWVYVGAQAKETDFAYYEAAVFAPLTNALRLN